MLKLNKFLADESGAVTVDWVVLTAAIVGLGIAVMATVTSSVSNVAADIGGDMATRINTNSNAAASNAYSQ